MKQLFAVLMAACLLFACALAEDVCTLDPSADASVSTDRGYLRVTCPSVDGGVTLSVRDPGGALVFQKDYGHVSGTFRSDDVYLPLVPGNPAYTVTLTAGDAVYTSQVLRCMPRLTGCAACSAGVPLAEITGRDVWQSATVIDLFAAEGTTQSFPLLASNAYTIGTVDFSVSAGQLTVSPRITPGLDAVIDRTHILVATNALDASLLASRNFPGLTALPDIPLDLSFCDYAVVYVNLTVSFDPAAVPGVSPAPFGQDILWEIVNNNTVNEAVG